MDQPPFDCKQQCCSLCRVLVVDDNRIVADSLALLLQVIGVDVRAAYSGTTAMEMIESFGPELVFLDLNMPGMDGYETARRIRALPGADIIFLAALSAMPRGFRAAAGEDPFDMHIVKPLHVDALEALLVRRCSRTLASAAAIEPTAPERAAAE